MFARRSTAEILPCHQYRGLGVGLLIQNEICLRFSISGVTPIVEKELAVTTTLNTLEELFGDDLVGIDTAAIKRRHDAGMFAEWPHADCASLNCHLRTSVKCPVIAAAAAIGGLTRCVRPPRP